MLEKVKQTVEAGGMKKIQGIVQEALDGGASAMELLNVMVSAMDVVGERFQKNEIYVPEMLASAVTMQKGVGVLKPFLGDGGSASRGKFIIGTVSGDIHDIGKNLVAMMVESAGFEIIDLGVDVPASRFVEAIQANPDCHLVGVSALLTTTMAAMQDTVAAITAAGLKSQVKILVGGASVTRAFADEIGADLYAADAGAAAQTVKELTA